jgi:hypothetical protein
MTAERRFADADTLTPVMREVFGTDRRIAAVDRLLNGTKKRVYRITLDDTTSVIVYVWSADEDYWDGLLPDDHDDPSNPFAHASGIDFFEGATRRLESVGVRSPRLLLADRSKDLYPADIAVAEDAAAERCRRCWNATRTPAGKRSRSSRTWLGVCTPTARRRLGGWRGSTTGAHRRT